MLIDRLLKHSSLQPDEMARLTEACKRTLKAMHLVDRDDPITEIVARKVIEVDESGVRDPAEITKLVLKAFRMPAQQPAGVSAPLFW